MASEAELRLRYQTSRFREAPSPVEASGESSQTPNIQSLKSDNLDTERLSSAMSGPDTGDSTSGLADSGPASDGLSEGHSGAELTEPMPTVAGRNIPEMEEPQDISSVASQLMHTTVETTERMEDHENPPPQAEQASGPTATPASPIPRTQEEILTLISTGNEIPEQGTQLPVDALATTTERLASTAYPEQNAEVPSMSEDAGETERSETRDAVVDPELSTFTRNNDIPQLDGSFISAVAQRFTGGSTHSSRSRSSSIPEDRNGLLQDPAAAAQDEGSANEIILPRWQPDGEVTYCPICSTQFSFFIRKHHCRKCGRVVCASCSPHRITIPYQFIVQPPTAGPATTQARLPLPERDTDDPSAFGGTKVRLCNPCVPDPNILPPQPQRTAADERWRDAPPTYYLNAGDRPYSFGEEDMSNLERQTSGASARARAASSLSATQRYHRGAPGVYPPRTSSQNQHPGNTSYTGPQYPGQSQSPHHTHRHRGSHYSGLSPRQGSRHQSHQSLSISSSGSPSNLQPHYRSLLDPFGGQASRSSTSNIDTSRPLPPIPRLREEDECPVCHRELPSRSLPDFETARANHITQCIEDQIAIHSGRPPQPTVFNTPAQARPAAASTASSSSAPPLASHPSAPASASPSYTNTLTLAQAINLPAPSLPPSSFPNTPEGRTAFREAQHAAVVLGHSRTPSHSPNTNASSSGGAVSSPPRRRTGMFPYKATEKDCVDDAECTICLEEFEVGDAMARLECLCRFHERCILAWWEGRPGRCPVHGHDGWGF